MKILVYSAVYGGFDKIRDPAFWHKDVDYHLFTDQPHHASADGWNRVTVDPPEGNHRLRSRRIKVGMPLSDEAQDYDATVWMDGSHIPKVQLELVVPGWLEKVDFAMWNHHIWQCTYTEIAKCTAMKKDHPAKLQAALKEIQASGFPKGYGQVATAVVIRRQTEKVKAHARLWLDAIQRLSLRDQVSLVWRGWQIYQKPLNEWLFRIGPTTINNPYFSYAGGHAK